MPLRRQTTRSRIADVAAATLPLPFVSPMTVTAATASAGPGLLAHDRHGFARPATDDEVLEAARAILAGRVRRGRPLTNPRHMREFLRHQVAALEHEVFGLLFLDNRQRLIECTPIFRGTVDGAAVHPREVVKEALARNAAAVILFHNHPSGVAEPSQADELITQRLRDALALIDVRILDHLVITGDAIVSFAERGLL